MNKHIMRYIVEHIRDNCEGVDLRTLAYEDALELFGLSGLLDKEQEAFVIHELDELAEYQRFKELHLTGLGD